jgi:hypothetical protein
MWHPLRGVREPFSQHRLLLARGHGSPYHQRGQNAYSAASGGAPRLRDGAEAEGYRSGAQSTQVTDEALQAIARSYRNLLAVIVSIQLTLGRLAKA